MTALVAALAFPLSAQKLDSGLGSLHWRVSTKKPRAQAFFDQGMKYVYAFNHEMAVKSFQTATKLDPNLAMGYWGAALALGPNINLDVDPDREKQAYDAVHMAEVHLKHASAKERDLILALANRYTNDRSADLKALAANYATAMRALTKRYPNDDNIAVLFAESMMDLHPWKLYARDGKPAEGTEEIVATLERVLHRNPNHLGANHYYVHAIEGSTQPERGTASAKRLAHLAPAAGHIVHMPAHILQRTGDYAGAARANEAAARADRVYIKRNGAAGIYPMMYYNHNLQFGAASYAMMGRYRDAMRLANEISENAKPMIKEMPPVELAVAYPLMINMRFGRWMDILKSKPLDAGPVSILMSLLARGTALAHFGDLLGAESYLVDLEDYRRVLSGDPGMMQNSPRELGEIARHLLKARIASGYGDHEFAINELKTAVEVEDRLFYNEPPDWWLPVRETLGAEMLRAGHAADAEKVFRDDLTRNLHNPRSLYGLAEALKAQKKDAAKTVAEFHRRWQGPTLTIAAF